MEKQQKITMKDVAQRAGVSVATVSAVINDAHGKIPVSAKSRGKVLNAIRQLDYRINEQARNLRTGKSHTIGVVISDITQPFSGESLRVVEHHVAARNYNFLISDIQNNRIGQQHGVELFQRQQVDGMLLMGYSPEITDEDIVALVEKGTEVVMTEREVVGKPIPCVLVDNVFGACLATEHLIKQGHRDITCVGGPTENIIAAQRIEGYEKAMQKNGMAYRDIVPGGITLEDGFRVMERLLERSRPPQAVVCFNDSLALGALKAIRNRGLRVPGDLALVGYDDISMAAYCEPALTTIRQPVIRMCQEGVGLLLDILEGIYPHNYYRKTILEPELVVRQTCGHVP